MSNYLSQLAELTASLADKNANYDNLSNRLVSLVLLKFPVCIFHMDRKLNIVKMRGHGLVFMDMDKDSLEGQNMRVLHADDPVMLDNYEQALLGKLTSWSMEWGEYVFNTHLIVGDGGDASEIIGIMHMMPKGVSLPTHDAESAIELIKNSVGGKSY